ncbi:MAG TPA: baseplate J/gp47 family protein [Aggregatilinea sp.]|uniref:baseplate J/gp47 family protein n=1 Tax=Aggregatilinea sp. TaxID=2806333 RepID=UPI002D053683|nr:baseplate J/gp47 family protein [Aggregatilinea sp.]HML23880.1 baseplate J/gp47 family protein [Aggregatilinea sp.]
MENRLQLLHLEPDDDAASIRDRLTFVKARFVLLVWPDAGDVLQRKLDLLLVQRQAQRLGIALALVTADRAVIGNADELNISVFDSIDLARHGRWKKPRNKVFVPQRDLEAQMALAEEVLRQREAMMYTPEELRRRRVGRWLAFGAAMVALLACVYLIAPSAIVTVSPATDQIFVRVPIVADPALTDIDVEGARVPSSVIEQESTARVTVQTSERESVGASLAQGIVVFGNTTDQPVFLPLGTVVATDEVIPVRFETTAETTLPAGTNSTVNVPIRAAAEDAGADGNVGPGEIVVVEADFADRVTVSNPNATYGGATQERGIVTQADYDRLLVLGRQQVLQNARDTLLHQLSGEQFLVPGSVQIVDERTEWTVYSAFVGDTADSVTLDLRAGVQAVVVDERQARQVAYTGLAPYIQPGLEVSPDALTISLGDIEQIDADGRVAFQMVVDGKLAVALSADDVRERVAGVSVSEARRRLEREFVLDPERPPQIDTWPGWWNRLPVLPVRISVRVVT